MVSPRALKSIWNAVRFIPEEAVPVTDDALYSIFNKGMPFKVGEITNGVGGTRGINISYYAPFHDAGVPKTPVGISLLSDSARDTNSLVVERLYTHSAFRGLGLARQVASNIFDFAKAAGYSGVRCLAGESHGISFWPRFMRFADKDAVVRNGMHGLDVDYYDGIEGMKETIARRIGTHRDGVEKYGWQEIDFDAYRLNETNDPDWFNRVLKMDKDYTQVKGYSFLSIGDHSFTVKGNMISDFSKPQDIARAQAYFDKPAPDSNYDYLRRLDSLIKSYKVKSAPSL